MESEGGGIVVAASPPPITTRRLSTQRSTLRDTFIASDLADGLTTATMVSPRPVSNVTLGAVLSRDKKSPPPNNTIVRTLLDSIHNDETLSNDGGGSPNSKKSWKSFKERLKRRKGQSRNTRRWASSMPVPQSDVEMVVPGDDASFMEVDSDQLPRSGGSFRLSTVLAAEREETLRRLSRVLDEDGIDSSDIYRQGNGHEDEEIVEANQPIRMSLMDLLEETDLQTGIRGSTYRLGDQDEEADDGNGEVVEELRKGELSCCVCMVRQKGAAFIPCGHTFCRSCCRELFVQRRNCPLCNNLILEILNIF